MAKNDEVPGALNKIQEEDVEYRSQINNNLFLNLAQNLNFMCNVLENIKCDVLPFGTTTWTSPDNVLGILAIGFSGAGGGGGTAPAAFGGGINNATLYQGSSGGKGGSTTFNGFLVAEGGDGGRFFEYRANFDTGGSGGGGVSNWPVNPQCANKRDMVKGLRAGLGGNGARSSVTVPFLGNSYAQGGAEGGESGRLGIRFFNNIVPNTTYAVSIGGGGGGGANHPITASWASSTGNTLVNSTSGANSPGMVIFCLGY